MSRIYRTIDYIPPHLRWLKGEQIGYFAWKKTEMGADMVRLGGFREAILNELAQPVKDNQIISYVHQNGKYFIAKFDLARRLMYYPTEASISGDTDRVEFERRGVKLVDLQIVAEIDLDKDVIAGEYINV